jgi:hypothetical protein
MLNHAALMAFLLFTSRVAFALTCTDTEGTFTVYYNGSASDADNHSGYITPDCNYSDGGGSADDGYFTFLETGTSPTSGKTCTLDGQTIKAGQKGKWCQTATVPFGSVCLCINRLCNKAGLLLGLGSYGNAGCTVDTPALQQTGLGAGRDTVSDSPTDAPTTTDGTCTIAGQIEWFPSKSKVEWCDGTNWQDSSGPGGASCAGMPGGKIENLDGNPAYCDGAKWIKLHVNTAGSCSGVKAGTFKAFGSVPIDMRYCNGSRWKSLK